MHTIVRKGRPLLLLYFILSVVYTLTATGFAFSLAWIIDSAVQADMTLLARYSLYCILFILSGQLLLLLLARLENRLIQLWNYELKQRVFSSIMHYSISRYETNHSAVYTNYFLSDCALLEPFYFKNIISCIDSGTQFLVSAVAIIFINVYLLLVMIALGLITLLTMNIGDAKLESGMEEYTSGLERYSVFLKEQLSHFRLLKMFSLTKNISAEHDEKNAAVEQKKYVHGMATVHKMLIAQFVGLTSTAIVMIFVAWLVIRGHIGVGIIMAAGQLIGRIVSPISELPGIIANFKSAKPVIARLGLDNSPPPDTARQTEAIGRIQTIHAENLSFSYDEKTPVLRGLSVRFDAGKKYLIFGESGCGKSTLLQLIAGIHEKDSGHLCVNDVEIEKTDRDDFYRHLGYVTQETDLLNGPLRHNLALYGDYADRELFDALQAAGLTDPDTLFPDGLDTVIDENGRNYSGGERQRIILARMLLHRFQWLLLDEFTANLDTAKALEISRTILEQKDLTVINVSHQLYPELMPLYDEIFVMKNGILVRQGDAS